jgi:hypothetical protein
VKVVLNSHRFWRDIAPEVLRNFPQEQDTQTSSNPSTQGDPLLLETILSSGHTIIITKGILDQYIREAAREGYSPAQMLNITEQLAEDRAILHPRLPGGRRRVRGIPERHRAFLEDAIIASADFFVTENPVWLNLSDRLLREHGLRIITPGAFINCEGNL